MRLQEALHVGPLAGHVLVGRLLGQLDAAGPEPRQLVLDSQGDSAGQLEDALAEAVDGYLLRGSAGALEQAGQQVAGSLEAAVEELNRAACSSSSVK